MKLLARLFLVLALIVGQFSLGYATSITTTGAGKPSAAAPSGYSFTMTAGDLGFGFEGYYPAGGLGSIDAEPIPGNALIVVAYDANSDIFGSNGLVGFTGDIVALLTGLTVWVDGVQYATNFSGWALNAGDTEGSWSANAPVFVNAGVYSIEIK